MQKYKIYTKTGDKGKTSLLGGVRVSKSSPRVDAYGTIDELNSYIGICFASLDKLKSEDKNINIKEILNYIQNKLFTIGSLTANDPEHPLKIKGMELTKKDITIIEGYIKDMSKVIKSKYISSDKDIILEESISVAIAKSKIVNEKIKKIKIINNNVYTFLNLLPMLLLYIAYFINYKNNARM